MQRKYICVVPYNDANWIRFFEIAGRPDVLSDDRFSTPGKRYRNTTLLNLAMADALRERTTAEWVKVLNAESIPAMGINDLDNVTEDPHLKAIGFFQRRSHASAGDYLEMRAPIHFGAVPGTRSPPWRCAPELGEHTEEVLAEVGATPRGRPGR